MPIPMPFEPPNALGYFDALVQSDRSFPLLEAAICLGHIQRPTLDVQEVLLQMDTWLLRLRRRVAPGAGPLARLVLLNQFFFGELGFRGNLSDYSAPENSFIHHVIAARRGVSVVLALLWLEFAQGLGLDVAGVGFPGHVLVKVYLPNGQVVINPMNGQSYGAGELAQMLAPARLGTLDADDGLALGPYLQPVPERDILVRILRHLKEIYKAHRRGPQWLAVQERLVVLLPECWSEYRDRGLAHVLLGEPAQALSDLECYCVYAPDAPDSEAIGRQMDVLRGQPVLKQVLSRPSRSPPAAP